MKAIVYKSNAGHTMQYAIILSKKLNIPCYDIKDAIKYLSKGDEIIYLGWVCAGRICGYSKSNKMYDIKCCGAVGIYPSTTEYLTELKNGNNVNQELFYMRGGIDYSKLNWLFKKVIKLVGSAIKKENKSGSEELSQVLENGASFVSEENTKDILDYINSMK